MQLLRGNADLGTQPEFGTVSKCTVDVLTYTAEASVILQNTLAFHCFRNYCFAVPGAVPCNMLKRLIERRNSFYQPFYKRDIRVPNDFAVAFSRSFSGYFPSVH